MFHETAEILISPMVNIKNCTTYLNCTQPISTQWSNRQPKSQMALAPAGSHSAKEVDFLCTLPLPSCHGSTAKTWEGV